MRLEQSIRESVFLLGEVHRTLSTHPHKDHDIDLFEDMLLEVEMQIDRLKLEAKTLANGTHPIMVQSSRPMIEQQDTLLKFVTSCTEVHPDETPSWFLQDYRHEFNYGGEDNLEEFDADEAFDSYRDKYGHLDTDTLREICEGAREIVKGVQS